MNKSYKIFLFIIGVLFLITRLPLIDKDIPSMGISGYSQVDESFYAVLALDKIDYGSFFYNRGGTINYHSFFIGSSLLLNGLCYFTLSVFGDTYWGLRFTSILLSALVMALIIISFRRIQHQSSIEKHPFEKWVWPLLMLILLTDFSFLFSNIVIEPTLLRMAVSLVMILYTHRVLAKKDQSAISFTVLGAAAVSSWTFIYLTNAFIPASVGVAIVVNNLIRKQNIFKNILPFIIGAFVGLFFYFGISILYGVDVIEEFKNIYQNYGSRLAVKGGAKTSFIKTIVINAFNFFRANFLNYNPLLLGLFLTSLLYYGFLLVKQKTERRISIASISLTFLLVFFCQSLFVNDYFTRKLIITYPFYLLITYHVIHLLITNTGYFNKKVLLVLGISSFLFVGFSQLSLGWIYNCSGHAFLDVIIAPSLAAISIAGITILLFLLTKKPVVSFLFLLGLLIVNNSYYTYKAAYRNVTDNYKQSMIRIAPIIDGKTVVGEWSLGFRLYNNARPVINWYAYNRGAAYENDIKKVIAQSPEAFMVTRPDDTLINKLHLQPQQLLVDDICYKELTLYKIK